MLFRRQLAAHSPIPLTALVTAAGRGLLPRRDARRDLLATLLRDYAADSGILCGSGTQALQLAITLARPPRRTHSAVALPAFCCYDVAAAAVGADALVALYDVDPDTLAPDLASLERVMRAGARVVVIAPLYGYPVDWEAVSALAERHGAVLIEDAAQGHGATWRGRPLGSLGALSVLSFGRGKGWTGGRGGALLLRTRTDSLSVESARGGLSNVVGVAAQWMLGRPRLYGIPAAVPGLGLGETVYHDPQDPAAITRSAASLLLRTRRAAAREAERRVRNARALLREIARADGVETITIAEGGEPGWLRLPVRLDEELRRIALSRRGRLRGIAPSYPTTLAELPQIAERLSGPERQWPGAERLVAELVTLPTHSRVTNRDRRKIAALLRSPKRIGRAPVRDDQARLPEASRPTSG